MHIDDTPHRLALGVALGIFMAWTPAIGLQSAMVIIAATIFRANKISGLPFVWITNPLTIVPIYWPNYLIGNALMNISCDRPRMTFRMFESAIKEFLNGYCGLLNHQTWTNFYSLMLKFIDFTVDLWVGCLIVGLILSIIAYFASYRLINWYRNHTPHGRAFVQKMLRRKKLRLAKSKQQQDGADNIDEPSDNKPI